jgi:DNA-binding MarR family transcriptional regulator
LARKVALSEGTRPPGANVDLGEMADSVAFQLRQTSYAVHQAFARRFSRADAVPRQYSVLHLISINPGISVKDLAAAIGVDQSTLVPTLNVCEERGWIVRERTTRDRRLAALGLTDSGRDVLAEVERSLRAHEAEVTGGLTRAERRQLVDMLRRVRAAAERA